MDARLADFHYNQRSSRSTQRSSRSTHATTMRINETNLDGEIYSWQSELPKELRVQLIVNTDAAHRSLDGSPHKTGSGGIVFRNQAGEFLVGFSILYGPRSGDATEVEAETIYLALKIIERKRKFNIDLDYVEIQSDSKYAVEMYNNKRAIPNNMVQIMTKCFQVNSNLVLWLEIEIIFKITRTVY